MNFFLLVLGLALLTIGGEGLIRGSLSVARRLGVSPLLSGLVIVGFGTSAPELVVTMDAALSGRPDIAVGNVVGSNIANIFLILGICALMVAASVLFIVLVGGSALGPIDASILLLSLAAYLVWAYWSDRDQAAPSSEVHRSESEEIGEVPKTVFVTVMFLVAGLAMLIGGAHVLIKGAVGIAEHLGVSEAVIGLTLVAVGTSLPELSISVIAAVRRHADVAVGNILGSNIFNLLGILGVSALLQPLPVHVRILQLDQWVMLAAAVLLLAFLCTARRLSRLEGFILVACYGSYIGVGIAAFD